MSISKLNNMFGMTNRKIYKQSIQLGKDLIEKVVVEKQKFTPELAENCINKILPKNKPLKIVNDSNDVIKLLKNAGFYDETINQINNSNTAFVLKSPKDNSNIFYVPNLFFNNNSFNIGGNIISHEFLHHLQNNFKLYPKIISLCAINSKNMAQNRLNKIYKLLNINKFEDFQNKINQINFTLQNSITDMIVYNGKAKKKELVQITDKKNMKDLNNCIKNKIEEIIINPNDTKKANIFKLNFIKTIIKQEIPAYKAGGIIERKITKLNKKESTISEIVSVLYKQTNKVINEEIRLVKKNKTSL